MNTNQVPDRLTGNIAFALAAVMASLPLFFALFLAFGDPFGSITDKSIGRKSSYGLYLAG